MRTQARGLSRAPGFGISRRAVRLTKDKPRERFYLLPGQGGSNYRRKQQLIHALVDRGGGGLRAVGGGGDVVAGRDPNREPRLTARAVVTMRKNSMKYFRFILILALAFCVPAFAVRAELADGIKAVVNDRVITYSRGGGIRRAAPPNALRRQYAVAARRVPAEAQRRAQRQPGTTGRAPADSAQLRHRGLQAAGKRGGRTRAGPHPRAFGDRVTLHENAAGAGHDRRAVPQAGARPIHRLRAAQPECPARNHHLALQD